MEWIAIVVGLFVFVFTTNYIFRKVNFLYEEKDRIADRGDVTDERLEVIEDRLGITDEVIAEAERRANEESDNRKAQGLNNLVDIMEKAYGVGEREEEKED